MEAAARGAREAGGTTVGLLPGYETGDANPYIDIPLATGLGHVRNALIARSARALIALPGGTGTLSEVALGLKMGKRVVGLTAWEHIDGVLAAREPEEAVRLALAGAAKAPPGPDQHPLSRKTHSPHFRGEHSFLNRNSCF